MTTAPLAATASANTSPGTPSNASSPAQLPWQAAMAQSTKTSAPALKTLTSSLASTVPTVVLQVQTYPWSYYGDPVMLTGIADLTRLPGGGTMFFYDAKTLLGAFAVDGGGTAQMTTTLLKPGSHTLTALYKTNPKSGTSSPGVALSIFKRPLTLYPAAFVYSRPVGAPNPTFHIELTPDQGNGGLVNGDTLLSAVTGTPKFTTTANPKSTPSLYAVSLSGLSSTNYSIVYKKSSIIVYSRNLAPGATAPNFTGKDQFGNTVNLSDFRGKVVLLDLSTIWCGPSEFMGSQMRDVISDLQQRGVPFQYLSVQLEGPSPGVGGTQTNAFNFAKKFKLPGWTHVLHPQGLEPTVGQPLPPLWDTFYSFSAPLTAPGTPNENFGLGAFPTLAVINPAGVIAATNLGAVDKDSLIPDLLDPRAPDTGVHVTSAPPLLSSTASVSFTSTYGTPTTCRVDNDSFAPCISPYEPTLTDGIHEIQISAGRTYAASVPLQFDSHPPDTIIDTGPSAGDPTFTFHSTDDGSSFMCWIDDGAPYSCGSPDYEFDFPAGLHTFNVQATNSLGLTDPTPASQAFTTQPLPTITPAVSPPAPSAGDSVTVSFTLTDAATSDPLTGSVTIFSPQFPPGSEVQVVTLDGTGTATLDPFTAGSGAYEFDLFYAGDATHGAATSSETFVVP